MKNPRKSPANTVGDLNEALANVQQNLADLPFITTPQPDAMPQEPGSPNEESFRTFLQQHLARHKAPQALRERIKHAIKNMPD